MVRLCVRYQRFWEVFRHAQFHILLQGVCSPWRHDTFCQGFGFVGAAGFFNYSHLSVGGYMTKQTHHSLLILDGIINLMLGVLLLSVPFGMAAFLGVPEPVSFLYPCVLGGVLFGIGVSLILETQAGSKGFRGLGIGGAIVINFCGAGVLLGWLLVSPLELPLRGQILLWSIAVVVLLVGVLELLNKSWRE